MFNDLVEMFKNVKKVQPRDLTLVLADYYRNSNDISANGVSLYQSFLKSSDKIGFIDYCLDPEKEMFNFLLEYFPPIIKGAPQPFNMGGVIVSNTIPKDNMKELRLALLSWVNVYQDFNLCLSSIKDPVKTIQIVKAGKGGGLPLGNPLEFLEEGIICLSDGHKIAVYKKDCKRLTDYTSYSVEEFIRVYNQGGFNK